MVKTTPPRLSGLAAFNVVWIGQLVSMLASQMTQFALVLWVYEIAPADTRATIMSLQNVFFITPFLAISLFAGAMVDRYNRKVMMMVSDLTAGLATVAILILYSLGALEIWHLYVAAFVNGLGNAFQWPAYSAAISLMVPKEQLGRVNGMMSLIEMGPAVISPFVAGALVAALGAQTGVVLILGLDVATFILAILALLIVFIPQPERSAAGQAGAGNIFQEALYGFRYIVQRPSLLGLQLTFFSANFFSGIAFAVAVPMLLTRSNGDEVLFGSLQSVGAIGGILGGVLMSAWGGPKPRVHGILGGWIFLGLVGIFMFGLNLGVWVWFPSFFFAAFIGPIMNGSSQAIWQAKVAPDVQGRVFATRRLISWLAQPITPLIAGPLADFVLEPAMRTESPLSATFGWLVGTGPGAGMALLPIFCGLLSALVGVIGYCVPVVRNAETLIPDFDKVATKDERLATNE